jgi:predicted transcriptional regulator
MRNTKATPKSLSGLEQLVIEFLWSNGPSTSEQVRTGLMRKHAMKEATARTILRRLESKRHATHTEQGRTYLYSAIHPESIAMRSIRHIIDQFWGGSASALVSGMVDHEVIDADELKKLSEEVNRQRKPKRKS